jgi:sterol desaturase/sphingolipid hydroxylase (fatty acid hydroxylase superfamily)
VIIRVGCFAGVLVLMMLWEWLAPRRRLQVRRGWRWSSNVALVVVNSVLVRLVMPVTAVVAAYEVTARQWGMLNLVQWPAWLEVLVAVVLLDLVIYLQHVMFHAVPLLWRMHRVHHADLDIDVTTGLRFHTLEILVSAGIKLAAIAVLGATTVAVVIFEVVLNATAMFNHSNVRMP